MAMQNERAYSFKKQWVEAEAFREMIRLSRLKLRWPQGLKPSSLAKYLPQRWKRCATQNPIFPPL